MSGTISFVAGSRTYTRRSNSVGTALPSARTQKAPMDGSAFVRLTNRPSRSTITWTSRLSGSKPSARASTMSVAAVWRRPGSAASPPSVRVRVAVTAPVARISGDAMSRDPSRHSVSKDHWCPAPLATHTEISALAPLSTARVTLSGVASRTGSGAISTVTSSVSSRSRIRAVTRTCTLSGGSWVRVGSGCPTTSATAAPSPHGVGADSSNHGEPQANASDRRTAATSRDGSSASAPSSSTTADRVARPPTWRAVRGSRVGTIRLMPATATVTDAVVAPMGARASTAIVDPRATSPIWETVVVSAPVAVDGCATTPAGRPRRMTALDEGRTAPFGKTS